jgi:hypothetical protein
MTVTAGNSQYPIPKIICKYELVVFRVVTPSSHVSLRGYRRSGGPSLLSADEGGTSLRNVALEI